MHILELTGQRFNQLLVIEFHHMSPDKKSQWICLCDCGNYKVVSGKHLVSGHTKSCGCLRVAAIRDRSLKHGHRVGHKNSREYTCWQNLRSRCVDSHNKSYKYYGGRGIQVCERWEKSFENFISDMGQCPAGFTLDRIDNDGPYSPENCRWATWNEQNCNRGNNRFITFNGKTRTLTQWSIFLGINKGTLWNRLYTYKWSVEKAFTTEVK